MGKSLSRYEIVPGNRPNARKVYARLTTGELRRLQPAGERAILLRYDIENANKGHKRMKRISMSKKAFIFAAVSAIVIIIALTVNFPSF